MIMRIEFWCVRACVCLLLLLLCEAKEIIPYGGYKVPPPPTFPLVLKLLSNPSTNQKRQKYSHCLNKITTYYCVIHENCDGRRSFVSSHTPISVRQNKAVRCRLHFIEV